MCAEIKMYNHQILLSKEEIENHLIDYNPIHFTTIDFDHQIHLLRQLDAMEEIKYIIGIIMSLASIYYFVTEIFKTLNRN